MTTSSAHLEDYPKSLAYYHHDGLIDLFIGWVMLLGGLGFLADLPHLGSIAPAIFLPVWQSFRQKVTRPRVNSVDIPIPRYPALNLATIGFALGLLGLLGFAFLSMTQTPNSGFIAQLREYSLLLLGFVLAGLFVGLGASLRLQRMYIYSGSLIGLFLAGYKLDLDLGWILLSFGSIAVLNGLAILVRFLRQHPSQA